MLDLGDTQVIYPSVLLEDGSVISLLRHVETVF